MSLEHHLFVKNPVLDMFLGGFDNFFQDLNNNTSQPPHDIIKIDDNRIVVDLAVPGYSREDLQVYIQNNILSVIGTYPNDDKTYIRQNIIRPNFEKRWTLPEHMEIADVKYNNGILSIFCQINIPESKQKKLLPIN